VLGILPGYFIKLADAAWAKSLMPDCFKGKIIIARCLAWKLVPSNKAAIPLPTDCLSILSGNYWTMGESGGEYRKRSLRNYIRGELESDGNQLNFPLINCRQRGVKRLFSFSDGPFES